MVTKAKFEAQELVQTTTDKATVKAQLKYRIVPDLNRFQRAYMDDRGYTFPMDEWHTSTRSKYIALDCGSSGAFLIERATGEIFNIKAYGQADKNKKKKSNLGNVLTVDTKILFDHRYNYLR